MAFDYSKLKGKIVEIFGNQQEFAKAMGWSDRTLSLKLNGKVSWKQPEILKALELLKIHVSEVQVYFFALEVQCT